MKKFLILVFLLSLSFTTYANDTEKFIGTWRYVQSASADGLVDTHLGKHPLGYIIYTADGIMSVQIMNPDRTQPKKDEITDDFFAYSGHYNVDEKNHVVTHHLEMAVLPEMVGKKYQRQYRFDGKYLYLTVLDSKKGQTLTWEKVESPLPSFAAKLPAGVQSHFANVNGVRLHYLEIGQGPLVVLLHGWPETSYEWRSTMTVLAKKYRVVAPDLRGLGLSQHMKNGYDKKTIATDIKLLIDYLGEKQAMVIGHDMGGKTAYVMAHLYPNYISKLILVDCLIPGTENTDIYRGGAWHYGFHMAPEFPEMLTKGREKEYIRAMIKMMSYKKEAMSEEAIDEYVSHYATAGGMTAGFNYYRALPEDAALVATFKNQPLTMPVLAITGKYSVGDKLPNALQNEAPLLQIKIIDESGHFVVEEASETFNAAVMKFLENE